MWLNVNNVIIQFKIHIPWILQESLKNMVVKPPVHGLFVHAEFFAQVKKLENLII